jgi:hypothetical protein
MKFSFRVGFFSLLMLLTSFVVSAQEKEQGKEDEFSHKKQETKLSEVIPTDSVASSELVKRAVSWIKAETNKYKKSSGTTTAGKAECTASFPIKPKELNPQVDYTGKITMKVVIECKDSKYRYTISEIKHISKSGTTSGGNIDNEVPECGSNYMHDIVWKKLKGEALRDAAQVVVDLKEGMSKSASDSKSEDW